MSVIVHNDLFATPTELASLVNYKIEEVDLLIPWISALPFQTPININTASLEILQSLSGSHGQAFIEAVITGRPFNDLNSFYTQMNNYLALWDPVKPEVGRANLIWPQHLISVGSDFFKLYLEAEIGDAKMELVSILHRTKSSGINVISRDVRLLPALLPPQRPKSEIEKLFFDDITLNSNQQNFQETNIIQPACLMMEYE